MSQRPKVIPPEERQPLSGSEYYALRAMMGMVSTFETEIPAIEKRLRSIDGGWRDTRLIQTKAAKLLDSLIGTIPPKKLMQIRQEISHTRVEINVVRDVSGRHRKQFTYVPNDALEWLEEQIIDMNCIMCDKTAKESRRCPIRRHLKELYCYDIPEHKSCPIAQMNIEQNQP